MIFYQQYFIVIRKLWQYSDKLAYQFVNYTFRFINRANYRNMHAHKHSMSHEANKSCVKIKAISEMKSGVLLPYGFVYFNSTHEYDNKAK